MSKARQANTHPGFGAASLQPGVPSIQWSIYWANAADGVLEPNPMVGQFSTGRGEFYSQQVYEGKAIYARFVWSGVTTKTPHFEQSFSADGGKTWETNWITDQTREKP
jgi:hypothetical protein